jgi:hypothetical protein
VSQRRDSDCKRRILSRIEGTIGVAAFSRIGDTETGLFEDAVMLKAFGDIPADLTMMF